MKQNLTNALVKNIVNGVNNKKFMYGFLPGIYHNMNTLIYTYDGYVMYKVEADQGFIDYVSKVKQPAVNYDSINKVFTGMNKYIRTTFTYNDLISIKHSGSNLLQIIHDGYKYCFDPRFLTKFKNSRKYELNLWVFGFQHGLIVNEYDEHDDRFDQVALIMGVLT